MTVNDIQSGNGINAVIRDRRGNPRRVRGEVGNVYRRSDGSVSFFTVYTGRSATHAKRYVNAGDIISADVITETELRALWGDR